MTKLYHLNTPYQIKGLSLKNRVVMPPMCQYQAQNGIANEWHYVHYASRAVGGVGFIIVEMTSVAENGRISPNCLGLWNDDQRDAFKPIVDAAHAHNSKIAIQIAHAGRKSLGEENVVSSSPMIYEGNPDAGDGKWAYKTPKELSQPEIAKLVQAFQDTTKRAIEIGFDAIELHGAHGYLIHQFYSPKLNQRTDEYGQDKFLFGKQIIKAVKEVMPAEMPLIIRISAQEFGENGFDLAYGCEVAKQFVAAGVDVVHVSGGGDGQLDKDHHPSFNAGYQVPFARAVKQATNVPVIAVGKLEDPELADYILASGDADLIAVGRGLLRDPYWALNSQYDNNAPSNEVQFTPKSYQQAY
ncbi:2 [Commensalibacter communis]|uniref:NADH:flavin oxidoreductase/NADH oxidase n=1 Tax=Commensalibacter communis TaxID=2972786 RepID=UPI0022FFA928|nr:NADH:flavin oxidoreductase/NADH oxidase [Commensalibacter communis]CAI3949120.1 2 [Commensalibacter communis] [Commensalibacter communis]